MTILEDAAARIDKEEIMSSEILAEAGKLPEMPVTVSLMESNDYKKRMLAEYWQLKIRYEKLKKFNNQIEASQMMNRKEPEHTCPVFLLKEQEEIMGRYLHILEIRAVIEEITL